MENPSFLISDYLSKNNNNNNIELLRSNLYSKRILSKDYPEENLILLYNRFESKNKNDMERECRSVILDRNNFNIVSYTCNTPITNMTAINYMLKKSNDLNIFKC